MTIPEILKKLETVSEDGFPAEAVKAAVEQRDAITPHLLQVLDEVAADPLKFARRPEYMLHICAMFLLAEFREKRAYPVIVTICRAPGELTYALVGDVVTDGLYRILASVYDGDPAPIQSLVESVKVDEFVRDAAINAFDALVRSGQMSRDTVVDYFRALFHGRLERKHSQAWDGLVWAVADLPAPELLDEVRQAYADRLIDRTVAELEVIERGALSPKRERQQPPLINDTAAEMEYWGSFRTDEEDSASGPTRQDGPSPAATMTVSDILNQFTACAGYFPILAMEAAVQQQAAITPHLLRALEEVAADPVSFADKPDCVLHQFAIMLLAQFREKQACPLIISIFSAPGDIPEQIGGFLTQDSLGRVLASVYDGNPGPLQNLIENEAISELVRDEAVRAFVCLARSNQIPTQFVLDYFGALMREKLPREESNVWLALARAVADLPAPELMDDMRKAFDDGLIHPDCLTWDEFEEGVETRDAWREEQYSLITDASEEMELWPEYLANDPVWDEEDSLEDDNSDDGPVYDWDAPPPAPPQPTPSLPAYEYTPQQPFVREPKIGRNDPCPCGSGKKYKKCCGKN